MTTVRLNSAAIREWGRSPDAKRVLDSLGEQIAEDASHNAPRRTGGGAESIDHEVGEDTDGAYVRISWSKSRFYLFFHEVGTSKMSARPFLRPAAEKRRTL